MKIQNQKPLQFKLKQILFTISLLFCLTNVLAQHNITGKLEQSDNSKNQFTEVSLINKDSIIVKNDLINEDGTFSLKVEQSGTYVFKVKQLGEILFNKQLQVNSDINLGIIQLEGVKKLEEVVVSSKRKMVERKIDRVVFNVEKSIATTGGDALDALKITPGVKVQNDNISIIGKGVVSVMIDDKIIQLKQEELGNFLKSISADNIKSIEVITTPPAKYDAAGNSGMINIKTKTAKKDSWNSNFGIGYLQRSRPDGSSFLNFNMNKNKFTLTTALNYRQGKRLTDQDDYAYFTDALWYTKSPFLSNYKRFGGKIGIDYQINKFWKSGIQYMINNNRTTITDSPYTSSTNSSTKLIEKELFSVGNQSNKPKFNSINFHNEFKLDTLNRKISFDIDYFNFSNQDNKYYDGKSVSYSSNQLQYFKGENLNKQDINNYSAKIDIDYPIKGYNLSFGGKLSFSNATNEMNQFNSGLVNLPISQYTLNPSNFEYKEYIQALYVSVNKKFNEKWETQLGLRYESTILENNSNSLNTKFKSDYAKLFPSLNVNYSYSENSTFSLNYSRRIERPTFMELNPNEWYVSPFQKIGGNPFLLPAFIDNIDFVYNYKTLESKIYFAYEDNLYGQVSIPNSFTKDIVFTNKNYVKTSRIGFSESYIFEKYKWWTSTNSLDINYVQSKSFISLIDRSQTGWNSRFSTNNDFIIDKNKSWVYNINFWYSSKGVDGKFYNIASMSNLSMSLQYSLKNHPLKITLKANDLFKSDKINVNSYFNSIHQNGIYYSDNQYIQLNISYKIGNQKLKSVKRPVGNEEERNRTGN
ncbi:TonB-dependent receptor [Flavobacterium oreochromis]|uniref:TonB-dependent receptor n=1 Tax=Flavobacterium oreochromis TaxID=2906078 RepID=A0ABW8PD33_9FLAO|nr:TonB-dependent receptor [Flavobacterium oreochromis]OWP74252.1 hypothetical protein BWG23_14465 [Flavobacterium oreochromis]